MNVIEILSDCILVYISGKEENESIFSFVTIHWKSIIIYITFYEGDRVLLPSIFIAIKYLRRRTSHLLL